MIVDRLLLPVLAVAVAACGNDAGGSTDSADASTDVDTTQDAASGTADGGDAAQDAGATCAGPISNSAPVTNEVAVASDAPAPTGGAVTDGIYYLATWSVYTGNGGQAGTQSRTLKFTLRVTGTTWQFAISENGGTLDYGTQSVTYSGTSYTANLYCPPPPEAKGATQYSATATELRIFDPTIDSAGTSVLVLKKQ